jgi:ankyrin repeat protein
LDVKEKLKLNVKDIKGNTPLFYSIIEDRYEYFQILIKENDIAWDLTNNDGMNAFHISCYYGRYKIIEFFLKNEKYSKLLNSVSKNGYTPLHFAVISNSVQCLTLLLNNKVDINIQDSNGDTPLHLAIRKSNYKLIYYLSISNPNLNLSNKRNEMLKNLMKKIDLKPYVQNNFENLF